MKKIFKRILISLAVIGFIFIVSSNFLPNTFKVSREKEIAASPAKVFEVLSDLDSWEAWAPFSIPMEENAEVEYGLDSLGKGAEKKWSIDKKEIGWIRITHAESAKSLKFEYTMDAMKHIVEGDILIIPSAAGSNISWTFQGRFQKQPLEKYLGLWVDDFLGERINETLNGLDAYCTK